LFLKNYKIAFEDDQGCLKLKIQTLINITTLMGWMQKGSRVEIEEN